MDKNYFNRNFFCQNARLTALYTNTYQRHLEQLCAFSSKLMIFDFQPPTSHAVQFSLYSTKYKVYRIAMTSYDLLCWRKMQENAASTFNNKSNSPTTNVAHFEKQWKLDKDESRDSSLLLLIDIRTQFATYLHTNVR